MQVTSYTILVQVSPSKTLTPAKKPCTPVYRDIACSLFNKGHLYRMRGDDGLPDLYGRVNIGFVKSNTTITLKLRGLVFPTSRSGVFPALFYI
jgi:hypothetical protein